MSPSPSPARGPEDGTTTPARMVLVTGSGRSGTSTVSGALKHLGFHVPLPEVAANASNPRGFFEPRWAVEFHKRLLKTAGIRDLDARPRAQDKAAEVTARPAVRAELREWMEPELAGDIIVKDPRTVWFTRLWLETAESFGAATSSLTMLRHPAEVVGSRDKHYSKDLDVEQRRLREVGNVAGWINVALVNEQLTRGQVRAFVRYTDLISDWRQALSGVSDRLGLGLHISEGHHPIDDFIDATLHRTRVTWDGLEVPGYLTDMAEAVWQNLSDLADDARPADEIAKSMESLREEYDASFTHAVGMTRDHTEAAVRAARRKAQRRARVAQQDGANDAGAWPQKALGTLRQKLRRTS